MPNDDEKTFQFLTENSADMIFKSDFTPKITYVSPSCFRLLGWEPEELLGRGPEVATYYEDLPSRRGASRKPAQPSNQLIESCRAHAPQERVAHLDGGQRPHGCRRRDR